MGETGNASDQEFLLKEAELQLWVSFLLFFWRIILQQIDYFITKRRALVARAALIYLTGNAADGNYFL